MMDIVLIITISIFTKVSNFNYKMEDLFHESLRKK